MTKATTIDSVEEKSYAKTIWADFMEKALEGEPEIALKPPKGVTGVYIDPASGYTSGPGRAAKHYTYFIAGTEPADVCYGPEPSKKRKGTRPRPQRSSAQKSGGISGSAKKD